MNSLALLNRKSLLSGWPSLGNFTLWPHSKYSTYQTYSKTNKQTKKCGIYWTLANNRLRALPQKGNLKPVSP